MILEIKLLGKDIYMYIIILFGQRMRLIFIVVHFYAVE